MDDSACHISMSQIRKYNHALVEWFISDDKELYRKFYSNKAAIESEMGVQLEWNELPEKKQAVSWCIRRLILITRMTGQSSSIG